MTPATYAKGGAGERIAFTTADSPLGKLLVAATTRGLCTVRFGDDTGSLERHLREEFYAAEVCHDAVALRKYLEAIFAAITGEKPLIDIPLDIRGTAFQRRVWEALRHIEPGQTRSYSDIAQEIGAPSAVRAVARACATNPVAIAIPCHRVMRADGDLAGYRWGVKRKQKLLAAERKGSLQSTS